MDGKNGMILWTLGGAGVLFLYSAYKNKSPQAVLTAHLSGESATVTPAVDSPGTRNTFAPVAYQIVPDVGGNQNVYQNGQMVGQVPPSYTASTGTYIPTIKGGLIQA